MNTQTKKLLSFILACVLLLCLCACGKKSIPYSKGVKENGQLAWYLGGNNFLKAEVDPKTLFKDTADSVDPAAIYHSLEWTEQMLHGVYTLNHDQKDLKFVQKNIPFEAVNISGKEETVSILPVSVYFGADNIPDGKTGFQFSQLRQITDAEVAILTFAAKQAVVYTPCIYTLEGNAIRFQQIHQTSGIQDPLTYEFTGTEFLYDFQLSGPYFTLATGDCSLQLKAYCLTKNANEQLHLRGYSLPDSPLVDNLDHFTSSSVWNSAVQRDGSHYALSAFKFDESGRFTVYLEEESGEVLIQQYAYILQSSAGTLTDGFSVILLDGSKIYDYSDSSAQREARALQEQGIDVRELTEEQVEAIAEKKADLFDDLYQAFQAEGIDATINRATGEIALGATVLFDVNASDISGNGKLLLQDFMRVYADVVFSDAYEDFVSRIIVEGHTDTSGSYEQNQQLSLQRAQNVMAYCLSADCGISQDHSNALATMMEAVGCGYDKPIYDENGEVDMDASRRVGFKFVVNPKD